MKRVVLVALAVVAMGPAAAPAGAQTSPTLSLNEACTTVDGVRSIGLTITVSGLPPFGSASGLLTPPNGFTLFGSVFSDASGVGTLTFFGGAGLYTVEGLSPILPVQSLEVDCLPNNKDECKNSGWKTFGVFKNQGDCVSFVATKGKNPPANSP
jgi:hypothetical protein